MESPVSVNDLTEWPLDQVARYISAWRHPEESWTTTRMALGPGDDRRRCLAEAGHRDRPDRTAAPPPDARRRDRWPPACAPRELEQLKKQHGWGERGDDDYQRQRDEARATLAALPGDNRVAQFDAYRVRILELPEAIAVASPARREELCRIVLERVVIRDREVESIDWVPAARPLFEKQRVCPQGDSNP